MSFYAKKNASGSWSLVSEQYKDGKRVQETVPRDLYKSFGLDPSWGIEEARARVRQLNGKGKIERVSQAGAARRVKFEETVKSVFVNETDAHLFIQRLEEDYSYDKKMVSHWQTCQRIILSLQIDPPDFEDRARAFYGYFRKHKFSLDYSTKLLRMLNLWGKFVCRKRGQPFEPIPKFDAKTRNDINDAYLEKPANRAGGAKPLDPETLSRYSSLFLPGQWEWIYVSVWFGLRPKEVEGKWKITTDGKVDILNVYQTKLRGLKDEDRWKMIPVLYPEQRKALSMLKLGGLKRPLVKTMQSILNDEEYSLYSGRKGFTDLMLDKGQDLEAISAWLGHRTIDRTWRHYKNRKRVQYKKPG